MYSNTVLTKNIHGKNNEIHIIFNLPCIEHTTEKKNMEDSPHFAIRKAGRRRISKEKIKTDVFRLFIHLTTINWTFGDLHFNWKSRNFAKFQINFRSSYQRRMIKLFVCYHSHFVIILSKNSFECIPAFLLCSFLAPPINVHFIKTNTLHFHRNKHAITRALLYFFRRLSLQISFPIYRHSFQI